MLLILFLIVLASCLTSFTEAEVFASLTSLNPNEAPGPDNLHSQVLKNCAGSLAKPLLLLLFTQSINTSMLPSDWRQAHISPISSYLKRVQNITQQITDLCMSLTSQVIKVLETLIRSRMVGYLDENDIVTTCQHGFIKKKSCFTNLLIVLEDWTSAVDKGYGVDVAYLDFSKAFDSVPHQRLIQKLSSYGFSGKLLLWIKSFFSNRHQRVVLAK